MPRGRDVLIVKLKALGDVLRTTCLLEPLAARGDRVTFVTSPEALPLLAGAPLREALPFGPGLSRRLAGRFDLSLSLEEHRGAAALAAAAARGRGEVVGVRDDGTRLSYTPSSRRYYDMSLLRGDRDAADALKKANRSTYARLWLSILGLRAAGRPGPLLRLDEYDRAAARRLAASPAFRAPGPVLGLNPDSGARWPAKRLSVDAAARLLRALGRAFDGPLLLLGGTEPAERGRRRLILDRAVRLAPGLPVAAPPPLPLRSFAGIVERCRVLVTADSLAVHVAAAVGTPALALVGPTSAAELDFAGRGFALTPPGGCACFYRARCERAAPCLDGVPDEAVVAGVRRCLAGAGR